jgi:predicted DNA-binding protein with PD1-like motif
MTKNGTGRKPMKETDKHRKAFEVYYKSFVKEGTQTAGVEAVMESCKISRRTAYRWFEAFDWEYKAIERETDINERVEEIVVDSVAQNKKDYLSYIHALLAKAKTDIESGVLKIKTVAELKELLRVALLLQGEADSHVKTTLATQKQIEEELAEYGDMFELVALQNETTTTSGTSGSDNKELLP